MKIRKSY